MPNNVSLKSEKQPHQPPSAAETPVMMTWKTPWTRSHPSGISPPVPITRQSSLGVEHERLLRKTETRQVSLELLEARSNKRSFDLKHRHDRRELTELRHEKEELLRSRASLEKELGEAMADLKRLRHKQWKISEAFKKQAVLLSIEKDIRKDVEEELERCRAALSTPKPKIARRVSWSDTVDEISNNSDSSTEPMLGGPTGPLLHELLEHVRSSLTGTVSRWVKGMLAACAREIKEALILPWLLHKLFFLCNELIHSKREELVNVFLGGRLESMGENAIGDIDAHLDPTTAEFMHRHIRRHHLTLFPLTGDELKSAINTVMKALAKSMTDCKEWDPKAKNPEAVRRALAASGLEQIVREYLHILVYCCLQSPALTFSNDLGQVERYNPQVHSEPIDGEPADEFCVIIFPALIAASDSTRWGENEFMSPRYVLSSEGSTE